jgi:RNA polymerase sigma-70 factor (ECF subfamily)
VDQDERKARLEGLFAAHSAAVLAYARRRCDAATADDVLSEVFAIAWRRLDHVPIEAKPWLLAYARRVLANSRRGERRRVSLIRRLATVAPRADAHVPGSGGVVQALATLGERDREALLLVAWDGLSVEEAGLVVGCSRRTFSMRLHRARKRLLDALPATDRPNARTFTETRHD